MRTRSKTKKEKIDTPSTNSIPNPTMNETNQWVIIAPELVTGGAVKASDPVIVKLRHPKTDQEAQFLISQDGKDVHEIMAFKDDYRSWFIDNTVQRDGSLLMATIIDPLFLILPYLMKSQACKKFMEFDQIVKDEKYPQCNRLLNTSGSENICCVCDRKGDDDFKVYRYSEEKTLRWLEGKVRQTAGYLATSGIHVTAGSQSSSFIRSSKVTETPKEDCMRYGAELISDYLHPELSKKMFSHLGIKEVEKRPKEATTADEATKEPPKKKSKTSTNDEPTEDYSKTFNQSNTGAEKTTKLTLSQKKLKKIDKTGMKSLSSFFKKAPAKKK